MKFLYIFITCLWFYKIPWCDTRDVDSLQSLNVYLDDQNIMDKLFDRGKDITKRAEEKCERYVLESHGSAIHTNKSRSALFFTISDSVYLILGKDIYLVSWKNHNLEIISKNVTLNGRGEEIDFVRATNHEGIDLIVQRMTSGESQIYDLKNGKFIETPKQPCVDAKFFENNNNLYFTVLSNEENKPTKSYIYKWQDSHFVEIQRIFTIGAIKVTSFSVGKSEILIVLQTHSTNKTIEVYEFANEKIASIQNVTLDDPLNMDTFVNLGQQYVIVYQKNLIHKVYQWNGKRLREDYKILSQTNIIKSAIWNTDYSTLILSQKQAQLELYKIYPKIGHLQTPRVYNSGFSKILDIINNGSDFMFVVGQDPKGQITIEVLSLNVRSCESKVETTLKKEYLRECFNELEQKVYDIRKTHEDIKTTIALEESELKNTKSLTRQSTIEEEDLEEQIATIKERIQNLTAMIESRSGVEGNNININKTVSYKGTIEVNDLIGHDVEFKEINSIIWTPQNWLRYKAPQTITGPVKISSLIAGELETSPEDTTFQNLLMRTGDQKLSGKIVAKSVRTNNIFVESINGISLDTLYLKSKPEFITGLKKFQNLKATEAFIEVLNEKNMTINPDLADRNLKFGKNVTIQNLEVETVDGVPWNEFKDSVFRASKTNEIIGNLKIPTLKTVKINLKTLNGIKVEDLLTVSTNQTIFSNIGFKRIFARKIESNLINGINLNESAAQMDQNTPVKGPVTLEKMSIANNLNFVGKVDKAFLVRNGGRIIGTNESDLLQIYKSVKLKGNLFVKDLSFKPNTSLYVSEDEMPYNFTDMFWTKNTKQKIPVRVHMLDSLTVPHLTTNSLNGIKFKQFMRNSNDQEFETEYIFDNVTVFGNVILNVGANHKPDLDKLNREAVKVNGSFFIHGKKTYKHTLKCKNLVVTELEGIKTLDTLKRNVPANITGIKNFTNIIIKGSVTSPINRLDKINGESMPEILQRFVLVDQPQKIGVLNFKHLKAENLQVTTYNDKPIHDFISEQKKKRNVDFIENLIIDGDLTVLKANNVSRINDILFMELVEKAAQNVGPLGGIPIDLKFTGSIEMDNLATLFINGIDLFNLTSRLLFREFNQTITAPIHVKRMKAHNVITPRINNVTTKNLIDVSNEDPQVIYAPKGIRFADVTLMESLEADDVSPCRLEDLVEHLHNPPSQKWRKMEILGNVTLLDLDNPFYRIIEDSVKIDEENEIIAPVNFSSNIVVKNMRTTNNINNVNISKILDDAVFTDFPSKQIITGQKWYANLEVQEAVVLKNADVALVNGQKIKDLNDDIVDKNGFNNTRIKGMKTFFGGLQIDRLRCKTIAGIIPENIVTIPAKKKIPFAVFDEIIVNNNLDISTVNNLNFTKILEERLLINAPKTQICDGIYFFDDLEIEDLTTPAINKIKISNLVFDDGTVQNISAPKSFNREVEIMGPIEVDLINGYNITEELENVIQENENGVEINGSITLLGPSSISGNISAESVNGVPITELREILKNSNTMEEVEDISALRDELLKRIERNWYMVQSPVKEYMYLDESKHLQIPINTATTAKTLHSKDYVHIHLTGEASGEQCGLPESCKCPSQNTLVISPELSMSQLAEKGSQRIFSYDDHYMTVHFTTNSVSMNSNCRTDATKVMNELSMMTWSTRSTENTTGKLYQYNDYFSGYISKVEFFTFNNKTYVIVGKYYDPVLDTYDLDCTIIRFNEQRSAAEAIQTIPTKGVQELYIFYTAQGIRLIVGNTKLNEEHTNLYTFNPEKEKFELLRIIPFLGCTSATGIILGADSLLALLGQKYTPVQILKYYPEFDNYYHFQSFDIEESVIGVSVFYSGDFGISDAYLSLVTSFEKYFIYSYRHMEGWKLVSNGLLEGLKNLVPLEIGDQNYFIALSAKNNSLLTVVKNGSS